MIISVLLILALCAIGLSWFAGSDAPYVPTTSDKLTQVLKAAGVKRGKIFYELGSGDGRVVLAAAQLGAESHGIEQSWIRVLWSRYLAKKLNLKNAFFYHGSIFDRKYFPADIVYIYMLQQCVDKLEKKLRDELKKGSIVVTQTYHFKNLRPIKQLANFSIYTI